MNIVLVILISNVATMKKTQDDELQLIILVLEARKKKPLTFKALLLLMLCELPLLELLPFHAPSSTSSSKLWKCKP
jgi:hypothetical protein